MTRRRRNATFVLVALAVALVLAVVVSPFASGDPDGLEKVAIDEGFADRETEHALDGSPTAGYRTEGIDDERAGTAVAGAIGVVVTFGVVAGLGVVLHRVKRRRDPALVRDRAAPAA